MEQIGAYWGIVMQINLRFSVLAVNFGTQLM